MDTGGLTDINFDNIFNGVVTAVQGTSDVMDAFQGNPNRRTLAHQSLQNPQYVNYQTGQFMGYPTQNPMNPQLPMVSDYSHIGYENQGYSQQQRYMNYPQSFNGMGMGGQPMTAYPQQNQMLPGGYMNQGHYDESYG